MASVNLDIADNLSITCKQGDTFELTLTLKDSSGNALPLATDDYKFLMQVKQRGSRNSGLNTASSILRVPLGVGGGGESDSDDPFITDGIAIGSTELGAKGPVNFVFSGKDDNGNITISVPASEMRRAIFKRLSLRVVFV
jgi:hypothetical protein